MSEGTIKWQNPKQKSVFKQQSQKYMDAPAKKNETEKFETLWDLKVKTDWVIPIPDWTLQLSASPTRQQKSSMLL